jgi:hypothetical protein
MEFPKADPEQALSARFTWEAQKTAPESREAFKEEKAGK